MPQVRVRDKHQITLPAQIAREANIGMNDILDVRYQNGVITLMTKQGMAAKKPSLMALAGSAKGLYGTTTEELEQYSVNERKSWER